MKFNVCVFFCVKKLIARKFQFAHFRIMHFGKCQIIFTKFKRTFSLIGYLHANPPESPFTKGDER